MLGTRDNAKLGEWAKRHPGANVGGFEATAAFGDLVVLAVKVQPRWMYYMPQAARTSPARP